MGKNHSAFFEQLLRYPLVSQFLILLICSPLNPAPSMGVQWDKIDPLKIDDKTRIKIEEVLKRLDDDDFEVREKAQKELDKHLDDDIKADYLQAAVQKGIYEGYELNIRIKKPLECYKDKKTELVESGNKPEYTKSYKILYVESCPRFEFQHLSKALSKDSIRLGWGLLLSADPEWRQPKPVVESKEVKFFPDKLEDLLEFHVIIIGDIDPKKDKLSRSSSNDKILKIIERFVVEFGRGLIFIAGDKSNPENFKDTPLEELLPFSIDTKLKQPDKEDFQKEKTCKVTKDGKSHPLVLEVDPKNPNQWLSTEDSIQVWEKERPPIYWYKKIADGKEKLKKGTEVLMVTNPGDEPLIISWAAGKGKVIFLATDETWRWRKLRGDEPLYYSFWEKALDWVSPYAYIFNITANKPRYRNGDEVTISAMFLKSKDLVTDFKGINVTINHPDGQESQLTLTPQGNKKHNYLGSFTPKVAGYHTIYFKDKETGWTARSKFYVYKK